MRDRPCCRVFFGSCQADQGELSSGVSPGTALEAQDTADVRHAGHPREASAVAGPLAVTAVRTQVSEQRLCGSHDTRDDERHARHLVQATGAFVGAREQ